MKKIFILFNFLALFLVNINIQCMEEPQKSKEALSRNIEFLKKNKLKIAAATATVLVTAGLVYGGKTFFEKEKQKWKRLGGEEAYAALLKQAQAFEKEREIRTTQRPKKNIVLKRFLEDIKKHNPNALQTIKIKEERKLGAKSNKETKYTFGIKEFSSPAATPQEWLDALSELAN